MTRKRERNLQVEDCPRCGSLRGERCRNYKGKHKAPCRIGEQPKVPSKPLVRKPVQRTFWDMAGDTD